MDVCTMEVCSPCGLFADGQLDYDSHSTAATRSPSAACSTLEHSHGKALRVFEDIG